MSLAILSLVSPGKQLAFFAAALVESPKLYTNKAIGAILMGQGLNTTKNPLAESIGGFPRTAWRFECNFFFWVKKRKKNQQLYFDHLYQSLSFLFFSLLSPFPDNLWLFKSAKHKKNEIHSFWICKKKERKPSYYRRWQSAQITQRQLEMETCFFGCFFQNNLWDFWTFLISQEITLLDWIRDGSM